MQQNRKTMFTSTYYNFLDSTTGMMTNRQDFVVAGNSQAQRLMNASPLSVATSPSDSSSSLNQFGSFMPASTVSSSTAYGSGCSSSSASSMASSTNLTTTNSTTPMASRLLAKKLPNANKQTKNNEDNCNNISHNDRDLQRKASITPTMQANHQPQLMHSYTLHSLEPRPLKPFKSRSAYIEAMKEDLSEWLNRLYPDLKLDSDNFFSQLETGAIICRHANNVTQMGRNSMLLEQAANDSAGNSSGSSDNSLTHETSQQGTLLSSPSPDGDEHRPDQILASTSFDRPTSHHQNISRPLSYRHRHSTTNSSISSITTSSSSASRQRLSLIEASVLSPSNDRIIDWFRVKMMSHKADARPGTFFARDNICQFIVWCRSLSVRECLLFETDDLVARKNDKSFILCLLEVARIGFKVGMPTPLIIQLEQEIDREIENEEKLRQQLEDKREKRFDCHAGTDVLSEPSLHTEQNNNNKHDRCDHGAVTEHESKPSLDDVSSNGVASEEEECEQDYGPKPQVVTNDLLSLHERVVQLLCQCTCPTQFPMVRIGDGKYKVGDKLIIFVRILRRHIMVRVGGGWQELSEFLRQKDPCRSKHHSSVFSMSSGTSSIVSTMMTSTPNNPTRIPSLTNSSAASRSRLLSSNSHLNRGYNNNGRIASGQKLISGSVSMSWLSHNS